MKTIFDKNIFNLAPSLLKRNNKDILLVIDSLYQKHIANNIKKLVLMDRIKELENFEIDLLAIELHVDFYEITLDLEEKRNLVKKTLELHMGKGTRESVQDVLDIFFSESNIIEWFEYGGKNGTFKIQISDSNADHNKTKRIINMINTYKRASQHLETLEFVEINSTNITIFGINFNFSHKLDKRKYRKERKDVGENKYFSSNYSSTYKKNIGTVNY
ncbi:MAG: phage tail protein I [Fusobacteriaceae bacterium]